MTNKLRIYSNIRIKAVLIDLGILFIIWIFILILTFSFFGKDFEYIYHYNFRMSLLNSLLLCKDIFGGQSFGKRIYKLKIVDKKTKDLNYIRLIVRNLFFCIAPVEFLLLIYNNNQRIGDIVIGSKVIRAKETNKINFLQILNGIFCIIMVFLANLIFAYSVLFLLGKV